MVIHVPIAHMAVARPPAKLRTTGLGSCVGVVLYDPWARVAGMAHIMLPQATEGREGPPAKFADTGIPELVRRIEEAGGVRRRLRAKIAGGANMFPQLSNDFFRIGEKNVLAVKAALQELRIPVEAEDVGGTVGRTIEFDPESGKLTVWTIRGEVAVF
ncbi:chemotaxis protein CheD [Brockia lithotrophica]|uniref:Probable chemoreceptor glutamine deamidase CheD n=1 Tax=Brockia lithotrophica TaxID=933949 RepID=A0A660KW21_9BACL|nr:chemotaxis protein CheD [Brockia lithotrophica]RKQ84213.1 chemotaxis protein CheD [Brockia lithotrophica]